MAARPLSRASLWSRVAAPAVGLALLFASTPARAQSAATNLAATDYLRSYLEHSHGYAEDTPLVPRFSSHSAALSRIQEVLMPGRKARALYLLGDDRMHLFPTRVGVLGWGMSAGLRF